MLRRILTAFMLALSISLALALKAADRPTANSPERFVDGDVPEFQARLPELDLEGVTLEQAFSRLADMAHVDIVIDWDEAERGSGINRNHLVTLHLRNVTARQAFLTLLCLGADKPPFLDYYTERGALVVEPMWHDYDGWHTRVYEVRDLIVDYEQFMRVHPPKPTGSADHGYRHVVDSITQTIENTIEPNSWVQKGGTDLINELGGRLIITTSRQNHRRIAALLDGLRKPNGSSLYGVNHR